jgi:hypothetical protein
MGWVVNATPEERDPVPMDRRLGGRQGRSGKVRKISAPLGFDSRSKSLCPLRYPDPPL